jgi:uncharacterized protein involved in exopolysaccharide biosynthesis
MIAGLVVVSVLATGLISKFSTPYYEAKATLLPVKEEALPGGGFSFGGAGGGGERKGGGNGGGGAPMLMDVLGGKAGPTIFDTLNVILASRTMAERVVEQLNLMNYYGADTKVAAASALQGEVKIKGTGYKSLEVMVLSTDPNVAADIANAYFSNLDRMYKEFSITSTKRSRQFIEARLEEKKKKLAEAENLLKEFQTENRILATAEQSEGAVQAAGALHSEIVRLELELAVLREYATPSHPQINQLQVQISELRRQLDHLDQDQARAIGNKLKKRPPLSKQVFPAYEEAPALMLEMLRLNRQVKVEEAVYGMLLGMLESAKISEARDLPTVHIMDAAIPASHKSRPKTMQNVMVAFALSLVFGMLVGIFWDHIERLKVLEEASLREDGGTGDFQVGKEYGNGDANGAEEYSQPPKQSEPLYR